MLRRFSLVHQLQRLQRFAPAITQADTNKARDTVQIAECLDATQVFVHLYLACSLRVTLATALPSFAFVCAKPALNHSRRSSGWGRQMFLL